MAHTVELREQAPQPALIIRTRTPVSGLPQVLGESFQSIAKYLGTLGQVPAGPPFTAYHNMDMQDLDIEIGFPVARALPGKGKIQPGELPGGKAATCMHLGPYSEVGAAFTALSEWIEAEGHEPTGVAYEVHLNDPSETPPQDLQTLILFPLKAK